MRSGVGTVCPLTLGFLLDLEETFFFLAVVEEVCAVPGWPAPDTTEAAPNTSAAPKTNSHVRLLIVFIHRPFIGCSLLLGSRNDAGQVNRVELIAARSPLDLEQDILSCFQARNGSPIFGYRSNRGVVDLCDDVAASKADLLSKAGGINRSDQRA